MNWVIQILCLLGSLAILLAAIGVLRFPCFFTRTHAATKASAFGLGVIALAVALAYPELHIVLKLAFAALALFLTLPVGSQALADAVRRNQEEGGDDSADEAS